MIQPELPYYHDITPEGFRFDPFQVIKELYGITGVMFLSLLTRPATKAISAAPSM